MAEQKRGSEQGNNVQSGSSSSEQETNESLYLHYQKQARWVFYLTATIYIVCVCSAVVMLGFGLYFLVDPASQSVELGFGVGFSVAAIGLMILLAVRNPLAVMRRAPLEMIRAFIVYLGCREMIDQCKIQISLLNKHKRAPEPTEYSDLMNRMQEAVDNANKALSFSIDDLNELS